MSRREGDVVTQRQQLGLDGVDQVGMVAAGKVRAADAACEQHVTHEGMARGGFEEDDMAGRVAGAMQHLQLVAADLDGVALLEPLRGGEAFGLREAEHLALLRQGVDPELVARMRADDGQIQLARQRASGASVVDVRVREPQGLERQPARLHCFQQRAHIATWVDQRGFIRVGAPNERAVLLEGCDGDGEALEHGGEKESDNKVSKFKT